jgi:ABC-type polysaccharide/polyol phosphate transport system ATPase subunit
MEREPIIEACGLEKEFRIRRHLGSLKALVLSGGKMSMQVVQALRGVDISIYPGESVALLGRNGSGKSTFLSLVARIYRPSAGALAVRAQVAPLLELGAGFHMDLTGRENAELNGVILGLTRLEVAERMDAIIEFSELREFIDVPLRSYSSGMILRLGFAVAVNTKAEILVVDEALAVGDEEFQEKCFATIEDLKRRGHTILFVSHELSDVTRAATRCIWLQEGRVRRDGDPHNIVEEYVREAHHLPPVAERGK